MGVVISVVGVVLCADNGHISTSGMSVKILARKFPLGGVGFTCLLDSLSLFLGGEASYGGSSTSSRELPGKK